MEFSFNLKNLVKQSGLTSNESVWELSTIHWFNGKRRASNVLIKDIDEAVGLFYEAKEHIKVNFNCHVIKECSANDRTTGETSHKTIVYQHDNDPNETFGITLKKIGVYE